MANRIHHYLVKLLDLDEDDIFNFCEKYKLFYWSPSDNAMETRFYDQSSSDLLNLVRIFNRFPGFRNVERLIEQMAADGEDFNPSRIEMFDIIQIEVNPTSLLNLLFDSQIRPFGLKVIEWFVRNGMSNFNSYIEDGEKSMDFLLFHIIASCWSNGMRPAVGLRRAEALLRLLLSLGLNGFYTDKELHFGTTSLGYYTYGHVDEGPLTYDVLLQQLKSSRRQPLTLQELARNATRCTLGGVHFQKRLATLPLPQRMKSFVQAT